MKTSLLVPFMTFAILVVFTSCSSRPQYDNSYYEQKINNFEPKVIAYEEKVNKGFFPINDVNTNQQHLKEINVLLNEVTDVYREHLKIDAYKYSDRDKKLYNEQHEILNNQYKRVNKVFKICYGFTKNKMEKLGYKFP